MATINFITGGYGTSINDLSGSGLGFFGSGGFGASVAVGAYQDTTFITNGAGTSQGAQTNNVKYVHPGSGQLSGATNLLLTSIPNYQSTLNIRFSHTASVRTQNGQVRIYDRSDITSAPTGVTCAVAHIIHPGITQAVGGSGSSLWEFPTGSSFINISQFNNAVLFSPGNSGLSPQGGNSADFSHDWYLALSASPNSVGSKTLFALYCQLEYL